MTDAEFWEVERSLWLDGPEAFRAWVLASCLMVFPEPAGVLAGPAILDGLSAAPRWEAVEISDGRLKRTGDVAVVLAYRAEAVRRDGAPYRTLCSSTYVREAGAWWLVQHQQTPV